MDIVVHTAFLAMPPRLVFLVKVATMVLQPMPLRPGAMVFMVKVALLGFMVVAARKVFMATAAQSLAYMAIPAVAAVETQVAYMVIMTRMAMACRLIAGMVQACMPAVAPMPAILLVRYTAVVATPAQTAS